MKISRLFRTVLLIAGVTSLFSFAVFSFGLYYLELSPDKFLPVAVFTSFLIFFCCFLAGNILVTRLHFDQLRDLYHAIRKFSERAVVINTIPKKIENENLQREIFGLIRELETSDKAEIVHLKELEVFRKEFLGNVSHELKTPIFTIQGYVHTLLEGGIEDEDINILYLQKASKSIDRLISIVDDLESISRLEAGELILENRTFDIQELVFDVIESLEMKAKESDIRLVSNKSAGLQHYVFADKDRIRQVLVNLVVNSIKYGKRSGFTEITVLDNSDFVTVAVEDNGIGIEKHHISRLFERFYRVDKSRSRDQGGTGLGLAIVKHIIEAHGQKISVESSPGISTSFTFTLKKSD